MTTEELNEQAANRTRCPAEWNTWFFYINARKQDTLNADEQKIMDELWSMTKKMDYLISRGIIARRKSL